MPVGGITWRHTFRALRHRNYRLFFWGQLVSLIGTWMQQTAMSWFVYEITNSKILLGVVSAVGSAPMVFSSLWGGALADLYPKRSILVATQAAQMICAFLLAAGVWLGFATPWFIIIIAAFNGTAMGFDMPARQAFTVEMTSREDLLNAISLNSSVVNGARVVGPSVAGLMIGAVGVVMCFFLNGLSFIAVIAGLLMMKVGAPSRIPREASAIADIVEGFRFVGRSAPVRALMLLLGLVSLTGMPYAVLMPVFADRILHTGASGLGILMGASGFGAFLGAFSLAVRRGWRGLGTWVAYSSVGFGLSLIAFSYSRWFWLSSFLLLPVGFSMMVEMAASNTLLQVMVPDHLRGRLMAVYSMMFMGMAPFGALLAGAFAGRWGAPKTVAVGGAVCAVGAVVFRWRLPRLRSHALQLIVAQESAGGNPSDTVTGDRISSVPQIKGSIASA